MFAAVFPLLLAVPPCIAYGVAEDGYTSSEWVMSTGLIVATWIVAVPLIFAERSAVERGSRGWSLISAACGHAALALVGTLPITLSWVLSGFGTPSVDQDWVRTSINTYAVLLLGYFVAHELIGLAGSRSMSSESRSGL